MLLIAAHSDNQNFLKLVIKNIETSINNGNTIDYHDYAILVDKYYLTYNNSQIFGTQVQLDGNNQEIKLKPLNGESSRYIKQLRFALGLPSLQQYLEIGRASCRERV